MATRHDSISSTVTEDDIDSLAGGDLGLGRGLKPGGIPIMNGDFSDCEDISLGPKLENSLHLDDAASNSPTNSDIDNTTKPLTLSKLTKRFRWLRNKRDEDEKPECEQIDDGSNGQNGENFTEPRLPLYGDVQMGTSIRQQKELFKHELKELGLYDKKVNSADDGTDKKVVRDNEKKLQNLTEGEIKEKLNKATQDVEILRQDLEMCKKQLHAKYTAITILQAQMEAMALEDRGSNGHLDILEDETLQAQDHYSRQYDCAQKAKDDNKKLQMEINKLEFELEYRQSILMDSQQTWAERFDKACLENAALMAALEARSEELRKMYSEKMAVTRDRDEILALLDVQERQKYERHRSRSSEEEYGTYTSAEQLAVLGACHCRGTNPEPCGCAHAAASLKRELVKLKEEIELHKERREEAYITVDAYRIAFDEQIARNRALTLKIADLTSKRPTKGYTVKTVLTWLIKQLNDDEPPARRDGLKKEQPIFGVNLSANSEGVHISCKSEQELVLLLLDMVNDRTEALAHQRLAARMLASKTKELEEKLTAHTDEVFDK